MNFVIENLEKDYGGKAVIKNAGFSFEEGKIYGLLGRNGAGKTTLFNCINGDIDYNGGEFYFLEDGPEGPIKQKISPSQIGYVLSTPNVPDFLTARELLQFFLDINPIDESGLDTTESAETGQDGEYDSAALYKNLATNRINRLFDIVKLAEEDRDRLLKDYSHGMKNKMQMLMALISSPKLLLLDEPLTSLDVVVSEEMKTLLRKFKDGRITIFSTHILDLALDLCDEIVLLSGGKLEKVEHSKLSNADFKAQIIEALKAEDEAVPVDEPSGEVADA